MSLDATQLDISRLVNSCFGLVYPPTELSHLVTQPPQPVSVLTATQLINCADGLVVYFSGVSLCVIPDPAIYGILAKVTPSCVSFDALPHGSTLSAPVQLYGPVLVGSWLMFSQLRPQAPPWMPPLLSAEYVTLSHLPRDPVVSPFSLFAREVAKGSVDLFPPHPALSTSQLVHMSGVNNPNRPLPPLGLPTDFVPSSTDQLLLIGSYGATCNGYISQIQLVTTPNGSIKQQSLRALVALESKESVLGLLRALVPGSHIRRKAVLFSILLMVHELALRGLLSIKHKRLFHFFERAFILKLATAGVNPGPPIDVADFLVEWWLFMRPVVLPLVLQSPVRVAPLHLIPDILIPLHPKVVQPSPAGPPPKPHRFAFPVDPILTPDASDFRRTHPHQLLARPPRYGFPVAVYPAVLPDEGGRPINILNCLCPTCATTYRFFIDDIGHGSGVVNLKGNAIQHFLPSGVFSLPPGVTLSCIERSPLQDFFEHNDRQNGVSHTQLHEHDVVYNPGFLILSDLVGWEPSNVMVTTLRSCPQFDATIKVFRGMLTAVDFDCFEWLKDWYETTVTPQTIACPNDHYRNFDDRTLGPGYEDFDCHCREPSGYGTMDKCTYHNIDLVFHAAALFTDRVVASQIQFLARGLPTKSVLPHVFELDFPEVAPLLRHLNPVAADVFAGVIFDRDYLVKKLMARMAASE